MSKNRKEIEKGGNITKIAFLFPGQGSQYIGMGKELWERFPSVKEIFAQAEEIMGLPLSRLCAEGPEEELKSTVNSQPVIFTVSVASLQALREEGVKPEVALGHSVGEYAALVAAGALEFSDALRLVQKRAQFMHEAVPSGKGKMAAIIGLTQEQVIAICNEASESGIVGPAAFNAPTQTVLSGEADAVNKAIELARESGGEAVNLAVSGPFHSSLMKPAQQRLSEELYKVKINQPQIPIVANSKGRFVHSSQEVREGLIEQLVKPILWCDSVEAIIDFGVSICIEAGPKRVLSGLVRRINKDLERLNVEDSASLDRTVDYLNNLSRGV